MGGVVHAIVHVVSKVVSAVVTIVKAVWTQVIVPIVEEIAALFGIEDKTVVQVTKVSTKIYGNNVVPPSKKAITRAVLGKAQDTSKTRSYFDHYWYQINATKVSLTTYYKFGQHQYPFGTPAATIHGTSIGTTATQTALYAAKGASATVLDISSTYPEAPLHFQDVLQASPYNYHPATDKLTYTDSSTGVSYLDWKIFDAVFDVVALNYDVSFTRLATLAKFTLEGDANVVEGNTAAYIVRCDRVVPAGMSVPITLTYSGTAPAADYTAVTSVVMLTGTDTISFSVPTTANALIDGNRTILISISSIDNTANVFEAVQIAPQSTVSTLIHDDEALALLVADAHIAEGSPVTNIPVTLLTASTGAFTVDYSMVAGTATAGADYVSTTGTLSYTGTLNEVQTIPVTVISDLVDDSGETFNVVLSNCSDPLIDISSQGIVTIIDSSANTTAPIQQTTTEVLVQPDYVRTQTVVVKYFDSVTDPAALDWHYWLYDVSSQVYTDMTPVSDTSTNFELFPLVVLRKNKVNLPNYGTAALLESTGQLLKKLHLKLDDMIANIEGNPDIGLVRDAYLNIAVSPSDDVKEVSKLLWNLFYPVIAISPVQSNQNKFFLTQEQDNIQNSVVWHSQAFRPSVPGVIGNVGDYLHIVASNTLTVQTQINSIQYDEIVIGELSNLAAVRYQAHHEIAVNKLSDADFTIPVSWYMLNKLTPEEQMNVYDKIIRLDFYAIQVTHIKWYQTGAFMKLFQVVLIIITIISAGTAAPATASAATAIEAASTTFFLQAVKQIAINYAIAAVVTAVAKLTGNETLAAIVGVIAAIAFAPSGSNLSKLGGMTDAKALLTLSTDFAENLTKAYSTTLNEDHKQLAKDITEFNTAASARLDEITKAGADNPVDTEFLAMLRSVDTNVSIAIDNIYNFDILYDYDTIVGDYHDNLLKVGVL